LIDFEGFFSWDDYLNLESLKCNPATVYRQDQVQICLVLTMAE
jgi:hypothetical protein